MDYAFLPQQEASSEDFGPRILGYYSRARTYIFVPKLIWFDLGGKFFLVPTKELLTLKGVVPYTAAAISSFAFVKYNAVVTMEMFFA